MQMWMVLIVIASMLSGCGDALSSGPTADSRTAIPLNPTTSLEANATIIFPQLAVGRSTDEALLVGELTVVKSCLRVISGDSSRSYLLVWPSNVTLRTTTLSPEVHDSRGRVVARVGEMIRMGGGELTPTEITALSDRLREPLPDVCSGPYWLVGEILS